MNESEKHGSYIAKVDSNEIGEGVTVTCICGWTNHGYGEALPVSLAEATQEWFVHFCAMVGRKVQKIAVYSENWDVLV